MDKNLVSIRNIMSKNVISIRPSDSVADAAKVIAGHNFDGVPVVDANNKLVGIVTEYDLIAKGPAIHLPTFQFLLRNFLVFREDRSRFESEVQAILDLRVSDVMNPDPLILYDTATYEEAVSAFRDHHRVNPIPVIDKDRKVVGVVSRFDVLKPLQAMVK